MQLFLSKFVKCLKKKNEKYIFINTNDDFNI